MRFSLLFIFVVSTLATPAALFSSTAGAQAGQGMEAGQTAPGRVTEVIDGDTVILADGREIRLVGLQAPKLALGRAGFADWPLAAEAKAALETLALGETVALQFGGRRMDRHGRWLAHLHRADGLWIQGEMLSLGWARVYSFADNRARVPEMLALEASARRDKAGIWAHPFYAVLSPETVSRALGEFALVEGRVRQAAVVKGNGFLNFGEDWREDFTIRIAAKVRRRFEAGGLAVGDYAGRLIRVRGWVESWNGPMIKIDHPERIEILE